MGQKPSELTPNASAAHLFGAELRRCRERQGLSLAALGERYERAGRLVHRGYLANVEQGERLPEDPQFAEIADQILLTEGLLVRLWDFAATDRQEARKEGRRERSAVLDLAAGTLAPMMSGDVVFLPHLTLVGTVAYVRMTRRAFLATSGLATAGLAAGAFDGAEFDRLARALEEPQRSDAQVGAYFSRMLDLHKTSDYVVGPATKLGPVLHGFGLLDRLSRDARSPARSALRAVQSEYASYAGWLQQEIGNTGAAVLWTEKAMVCAQTSGHRQMVTFATVRRANISWWDGHHDEAAELAAMSRSGTPPPPPGLASLAAQYEALAHASRHDAAASAAALDVAAAQLHAREASGGDELYWAAKHDHHHYTTLQATCHLKLGRIETAIAALEPFVAKDSANRLLGTPVLALAYAKNQQPELACAHGQQALGIATGSPARRLLDDLDRELEVWSAEKCVRDFRDRFRRTPPGAPADSPAQ